MNLGTFFAGMFLFNSLPHLVKGITGQSHMTPFKRVSSPTVNIVWAFANLAVSVVFLIVSGGFDPWAFLLGGFIMSLADAKLFENPGARFPWHKD